MSLSMSAALAAAASLLSKLKVVVILRFVYINTDLIPRFFQSLSLLQLARARTSPVTHCFCENSMQHRLSSNVIVIIPYLNLKLCTELEL